MAFQAGKFTDAASNANLDTYVSGVSGTTVEANNVIDINYNTTLPDTTASTDVTLTATPPPTPTPPVNPFSLLAQVNPFGTQRCLQRTPPGPNNPSLSSRLPWPSGAHASGFSLPTTLGQMTDAARRLLQRDWKSVV